MCIKMISNVCELLEKTGKIVLYIFLILIRKQYGSVKLYYCAINLNSVNNKIFWQKFIKNKLFNIIITKKLVEEFFTYILFIERQKKAHKIFGPRTWCTKKLFDYRVTHHGYHLMSCPGQYVPRLFFTLLTIF